MSVYGLLHDYLLKLNFEAFFMNSDFTNFLQIFFVKSNFTNFLHFCRFLFITVRVKNNPDLLANWDPSRLDNS